MADKKFVWIERPTRFGLIKNGKFRKGIEFWHNGNSNSMTWTNGHLKANKYVNCEFTVDYIPSGTHIKLTFVVDTLGSSAGYTDIYEIDSSGSSKNWKKVYFNTGEEISPGVYEITYTRTLSVDTYKFNLNFNHDRYYELYWVKLEIV